MLREEQVSIQNRKYLGSKYRLLDFIRETVLSNAGPVGVFIDGFSGTGVVADHFLDFADKVITNDLLYSNYVINKAFLESTPENTDLKKVTELIRALNALEPVRGYAYNNYGGTYFSFRNAGLIDAIRTRIEEYSRVGACTQQEVFILLTSLVYAMDKVGNTVGQYDAYLKHLGKPSYGENGRHLVDSNAYTRLRLKLPHLRLEGHCPCESYNEDLNLLLRRVGGDVLYLDPPYNSRQYVDCYHVLENVVSWKKPLLYGKTRKFERAHLKSLYSRKRESLLALKDLIDQARANHIFLSYNSEGIIPEEKIREILQSRGALRVFMRPYPVFGNGAGRSVKRHIEEYIYYCRVHDN
ncbi:MAG TPA: DNA adenine methylase [Spirochaetia bacterium]|nr:DNA adenine methylase [Spirochaetia bacterium]